MIDLSLVDSNLSSFAGCEQVVTTTGTESEQIEERPDTGCFSVTFNGVTIDDAPTTLTLEPVCRPDDTRPRCVRVD